MIQEDKELLLTDLCARLPYGVKVMKRYKSQTRTLLSVDVVNFCVNFIENDVSSPFGFSIEEPLHFYQQIKPYLRPMSSMTEEEKEEYCKLQDIFLCSSQYPVTDAYELFDWLNAHHFDYRGLIEKGLALEAPRGMYNLNK